jgi:hypothetical protein
MEEEVNKWRESAQGDMDNDDEDGEGRDSDKADEANFGRGR